MARQWGWGGVRYTSRFGKSAVLAAASMLALLAGSASAQSVHVPPIAYQEHVLKNGLHVVSVVDHSSPTVAVQVWYHVGSRNDPQERSGFAHLFEHLMFKSTLHMPAEQMDRLTEDVGGQNNAETSNDFTHYFEVVPSNYLNTLLWAEADRMANLKVDEANFHSERAVVEEEYRQSVLSNPYGLLFNAMDAESYAVHPYRRPTIGNIAELEASTLPDVIAFHNTFYRPDNATLMVMGDFDPKALEATVEKYFGDIPHPDTPVPVVDNTEPARRADRTVTVTSPTAPLPALGMTWLIPPAKEQKDLVALEVAAALLGTGESSRLHQALVQDSGIATEVETEADGRAGPGLFMVTAFLATGHQPGEAEAVVRRQIAALASKAVPAAELDKVKTGLLTQAVSERQKAENLGFILGNALVTEGSIARANSDLEALQAVSAEDVRRVVRRYLVDAHAVTIDYLPQHDAVASKAHGKTVKGAAR
ncbi:M16 family metallopeptidase [Brytella acorum]|uniref:Pitrilysin family protein n=1 Tax=Brytella acorum TaxID=2959299 RepID=A0AA35Y358_9PROT|nr:pitrilysin family protein [Brytella acorum]MDF3623679.1 pitrilysin family protein [Brytella acorum]CAI9119903.1 pitrilysin family protein [Brytella acorum]